MLNLLTFAALWAISALSADRAESLKTLIALLLTMIGLTSCIRWQTLRRLILQKEVRWQARLSMRPPTRSARVSSDFRVLSCNPATAPFLQLHSTGDVQTVPAAWHTIVREALSTGKQTISNGRIVAGSHPCVFSPVPDEDYVNTFLVDVTARHAAEAELRRQNEYLAALHETTLGLMNHLELAELLETIVGRATQLVDASFGWLYLVDPTLDVVEVKVATGALEIMGRHPVATRRRAWPVACRSTSLKHSCSPGWEPPESAQNR